MRSGNPALNKKSFLNLEHVSPSNQMTLNGTINKTFISVLLVFFSSLFIWNEYYTNGFSALMVGVLITSVVLGLILALVTIFKKEWSPVTVPIYALVEGGVIGLMSALFESFYPGIVLQAVALTFGTLFVMLYLYRSRLIKVTNKLRMGIVAATGAIFLIYMLSWILSFFNVALPIINSNGTFGIVFSLVVVGIAAFNLLLDFDFIERASKQNVPKYMEWYGAFGLLVTLIWLYMEILRLLSKLRSND